MGIAQENAQNLRISQNISSQNQNKSAESHATYPRHSMTQVSFATTVPTSIAAAGTAWIALFDVTMLSPGRSYRLCEGLRQNNHWNRCFVFAIW